MTFEDVEKITFADAKNELGDAVYRACMLLEQLENAGKILGSGHHHAQTVARLARRIVSLHWIDEKSGG